MHMAFLSRVFKNLQWYGMTKKKDTLMRVFLFLVSVYRKPCRTQSEVYGIPSPQRPEWLS